jgi:hypothetical protein
MHKSSLTLIAIVPISVAIIVVHQHRDAPPKRVLTEPATITTQDHLLGKTQSIDLVAITESAITASRQLITVKVSRTYTHIEKIKRSILGVPSDAVISLLYTTEYAVGYDLALGKFKVSGDSTASEPMITITLPPPLLVALPSVSIQSHEVLKAGFFIDEKSAVINLQRKLHRVSLDRAEAVISDPAVVALCEQQLVAFLHDILQSHPDVKRVPNFRIQHQSS